MAVATSRRLARWSRVLGAGPLLFTAVVSLSGLAVPVSVQYAVLIAGGLVVGIPHGALDWASLPLARSGRLRPANVILVGFLYAVLGGGMLLVWVLSPVVAAVGFLLLTWFHWGQGDRHTLRVDYGATYLGDAPGAALTVLVRGGIPMVVPLLTFPATYRRVLDSFVQPFGGSAGLTWLWTPGVRVALGGGLMLATLLALGRGWRLASADRVWWWDVAETASLWIGFLVVPPVLAIGLYFTCWHSWRHLARLAALDGPTAAAIAAGDWRRPLGRFAAAALGPTVGALALVVGLWGTVLVRPTSVPGIAGLGLVAIAILTLPHTVIVTWLDRCRSRSRNDELSMEVPNRREGDPEGVNVGSHD